MDGHQPLMLDVCSQATIAYLMLTQLRGSLLTTSSNPSTYELVDHLDRHLIFY